MKRSSDLSQRKTQSKRRSRHQALKAARNSTHEKAKRRFGILPNFFGLAPENPEITANLWSFASFAYLDNPLPSLFKERLFVYVSRFCDVRYCIARHVGFLVGLGRASGDPQCPAQNIEEVIRLLVRPFPRGAALEPLVTQCDACDSPLTEMPAPNSPLEQAIFTCAGHVFLQTPEAPQSIEALKRVFGEARFQHLLVFLAFVRTAHYWTKVHSELTIEEDLKELLATHEQLAECLFNDPEASACDLGHKVTDELAALREDTARLNMELRQTQMATSQLAAIVASSDDAIISKNLDSIITSWNRGAERLFGYTAHEAIGQSITMLIPPDRHHEESQILERLKRGETVDHFETVRVRKDGTQLQISVTISPLKDSAGRVVGASKIARDITERKKAEAFAQSEAQRLEMLVQQRTAKLQETIGDLEGFSYSVSHDLRAPLRAMSGYAKALNNEAGLSAQGRTYVERIERAATRLDRLTQEVLTYSQLARTEIPLGRVDLEKLVHAIIEQYPQLREDCIEIRSPLLPVQGQESLLTQALFNLLSNACKFVAPGARPNAVVRTEAVGEDVRVWVEDNGIGIAPEHRDRLFKLFGRIHPEHKYEGTGVGLAVAKRAIERMGGAVGYESEPGKGSRFWILLKRAKAGSETPSE